MKKLLFFFVGFLLMAFLNGCHHRIDPSDMAAITAKGYYDQLLKGKVNDFVEGTYHAYPIPKVLHEQLIANAKMFVGTQDSLHKGIQKIDIVDSKIDTVSHTDNAFLKFYYGDGTEENILVPMVEHKGKWMMR
ncbi:MAG: hypothetical protein LKH27_09825 [Prevotella sp.]|jgi:hypothetical protein|nr:hypothetical protein [Prevotella sp.]MCH3969935.1 hypothetical protein [Prevotella sp.]MCH3991241.1 hypothetical protein [Prevotella sp.]MCH4018409.1 hypothetical protein [Prevotella sp.]MCH4100723.1 hypothetical protein [Prevotella sp.]MCH4216373.1 hypothetical protein [Prevotella sp.]